MRKSRRYVPTNKNAHIVTRFDKNGKVRTETQRRDDDTMVAAVSTNQSVNSTRLFIDAPELGSISFDGRQARTLYRLLSAHYDFTGK